MVAVNRYPARPGITVALLACGLGAACGGGLAPPPERPQPIAWADTLPIAEPEARDVNEVRRLVEVSLTDEVANVLGPRALFGGHHEALNVDRMDDVVNSAWYVSRNRAGSLPAAAVKRGPSSTGGPADGPLTIVAAKVQGISPGFTVRDVRGDRYVLKFDPKGFLYLSSSAGVISNRLLYAAGYHVPEDYLVHFRLDRLRVEPGATYTDAKFVEQPLTLDVAREALTRTDTLPDGRYVAVASKFVPGTPKGPFLFAGVREDDPNDYYPHEHRRELRGLKVVSAWINHVDMRFMNTLDAYVAPGYLRHYLIDFAATLGSGTIRPHEPREGLEYNFDLWATLGRMFTLGFYQKGWEGTDWAPIHPSIGWMRGEAFEPERWKPNWPNEAFHHMTVRDAYWGAKLVGGFTDEQIRAAVEAGRLPDRWAADTLSAILETRRDATVRAWYAKVSPVENPLAGERDGVPFVRFDDAGLRDGPWTRAGTRYEWRHDRRAGWTGGDAARPVGRHGVEIRLFGLPAPDAVLEVRIVREGSGVEPRPARIYLRRSEDTYEVVGLEH
jgi:hypothetical protein